MRVLSEAERGVVGREMRLQVGARGAPIPHIKHKRKYSEEGKAVAQQVPCEVVRGGPNCLFSAWRRTA